MTRIELRRPVIAAWAALAAVPVVAMIVEVLRAPRLHFLDYWQILSYASNPDGSLSIGGLTKLHNEHPITLSGLLFWLDARILGGSNNVLGILNIVLVGATVFALYRMLPARLDLTRLDMTKKAGLVTAYTFLLYSSGALEVFGMSMSGASFLLGIVPSVFAILCAHRGRTIPALVLAVVGSLGHGTAFAVWPALALVAWLRRDERWRVVTPLAAGVVIIVGWLALPKPVTTPGPGGAFGFDTVLAAAAGALSPLRITDGAPVAMAVGALVAVTIIGLGVLTARDRDAEHAGWLGVGTLALGAAAMIGLSRVDYGATIGLASRYATIAGLAGCAALTLVVLRVRALNATAAAALACAVAGVTFAAGSPEATNVRNQYPNQQLLAAAMRVEANTVVASNRTSPSVIGLTRAMHAYPFSGSYTLDCGGAEIGSRVTLASVRTLHGSGNGGHIDSGPVRGGTPIVGWAVVGNERADCVIVVDRVGTVVGGGYVDVARPDIPSAAGLPEQRSGFKAVADPRTTGGVVLVRSGGEFYQVSAPG
ncbi:hypothetical protein EV193_10531 [Herbihabitans rhizosphaerae]|uniref:Uncharacterized protein n=1 Tax=Herbihabitans rhizosphaerae TaxID=1872711 RepID=A0A4Q7KME5_9PSEU|nr:hypothetical protein [Herbihabitans rhizosphaerae]RZS37476.1 hypothetical protein EV193_10531 [Herbihabitans rhizosphaerae]